VPLFVRAGAILPMQAVVQSTSETPVGPLELRVYPGDDCHGSLYRDDGHSFNYQTGEFLRVNYSCAVAPGSITVSSKVEKAGYKPWWSEIDVQVFGAATAPKEIHVGDQLVSDWSYDEINKVVTVHVKNANRDWVATIGY